MSNSVEVYAAPTHGRPPTARTPRQRSTPQPTVNAGRGAHTRPTAATRQPSAADGENPHGKRPPLNGR